ncbi:MULTISPECIES: ABC transporter permease [Brevibacillus]|jgi:putative spermidine/putrescine transport system permease protein|uniref:ABC transporter permease n=1 Tax=Brevibacillus parabrevis TaxID=54914 RepID=A0A4Y3PFH7_BREPA|nr:MULTISPECIES: ABC transporter permease [Brevibacillus]MBU8715291.1 ABC transporter permease [Brevibacillus parabrevis]MDH6352042.1 putative spermidine/putrescine transport system permease protein [Brevibacillus sp. 1238]MDR4999778.1 ABC transporter permease [Brevibacillus parabrevis]MED2257108.1 ABC transporter permease [Brevibacillus parabrevis]NRQ56272.1 ABC transporter permease [Brevibacillus sp. HD1.4A]
MNKRLSITLLTAPAMIVLLGVFILPMLLMLMLSFQDENQAFTLQNYTLFVQDSFYVEILWRTIRVSLWTVLATLLLGFPVAMYMAQATGKMRGIVTMLILAPHLISVVIRNFGWVVVLGEKGWINEMLMKLGLIEQPLRLLYNELGVVIGLTDSFIAYMVLAIATSLYAIDPSLSKAASILGASRIRTFFTVTLPLCLPGIIAGTTLVFSLSMSAFVTPALMGGTSVKVMPVIAYEQIMATLNWPLGAALAFLLLGSTILLVTLYTKLIETKRYKEVFAS